MKLRDVLHLLNKELRPGLAEQWDKTGFFIGDVDRKIKKIGIALDATPDIAEQCEKKKIDLLITHHPLYLQVPQVISTKNRTGALVMALIRNGTALYCAHTNLDALPWGTGYQLCRLLKLDYKGPLFPFKLRNDRKLITFVPEAHAERLRNSLAEAGAGIIGNYDYCSFSTSGTGSFLPHEGAQPTIGSVGSLETCNEVRLEMVVPGDLCSTVVQALKKNHPYEEPAYDLVPTETCNDKRLGYGSLGQIKKPVSAEIWLKEAQNLLKVKTLRSYGVKPGRKLKFIACMPGGGSNFISRVPESADLYISGDLKYHDIQNRPEHLMLIDAGHDATEFPVLSELIKRTKRLFGTTTLLLSQKSEY
jgi:dinuclear metal center YbgI/SA1388 family protein